MKIAVTGGAGYCGVPLCEALLAAGHHVTLVDNLMYGAEPILHLVAQRRLDIVQRDIRSSDRSYLAKQDVIFHLAAISGYPECEANAHSATQINFDATREIADALSPSQLLVFPSTTSFYGSSGAVCTEETNPSPLGLYGSSKLAAEKRVMERAASISLRWPTVFGVSSRMRSGLLINDLTSRAVREGVLVLYDPDSRRSFLHVADIVRGYLFALNEVDRMIGGVFNMGSASLNFTKREAASAIQAHHSCEIHCSTTRGSDLRNFTVSFDKACALGFEASYSLEQGISELVKLYRFYAPHQTIRPI